MVEEEGECPGNLFLSAVYCIYTAPNWSKSNKVTMEKMKLKKNYWLCTMYIIIQDVITTIVWPEPNRVKKYISYSREDRGGRREESNEK